HSNVVAAASQPRSPAAFVGLSLPFCLPTYLLPATSSHVPLPSHVASALPPTAWRCCLPCRSSCPPLPSLTTGCCLLPPAPIVDAVAVLLLRLLPSLNVAYHCRNLPFLLSRRSSRTLPLPSPSVASSSVGHLCSSLPSAAVQPTFTVALLSSLIAAANRCHLPSQPQPPPSTRTLLPLLLQPPQPPPQLRPPSPPRYPRPFFLPCRSNRPKTPTLPFLPLLPATSVPPLRFSRRRCLLLNRCLLLPALLMTPLSPPLPLLSSLPQLLSTTPLPLHLLAATASPCCHRCPSLLSASLARRNTATTSSITALSACCHSRF
ncbi:hypothetical protein GW17_00040970, partial [Ensete ventricosum]